MELENDGYGPDSSLAQLVAALNAGGGGDWRYVDAGSGPGDDPIRVGLIYRGGRVDAVGRPATLADGPFGDPQPRAAGAGVPRRTRGPVFVVVANHFKSKGCSGAERRRRATRATAQACWNATRTRVGAPPGRLARQRSRPVAAAILPLIVGDFNAYAREDPIRLLAAGRLAGRLRWRRRRGALQLRLRRPGRPPRPRPAQPGPGERLARRRGVA